MISWTLIKQNPKPRIDQQKPINAKSKFCMLKNQLLKLGSNHQPNEMVCSLDLGE
jgi:hypothetical protein